MQAINCVVEEVDERQKERHAVRRQVERLTKEKATVAMPALRLGAGAIIDDAAPELRAVVAEDGLHKGQPRGVGPHVRRLKWRIGQRPIAHVIAPKAATANLVEAPRRREVDLALMQLLIQLSHAFLDGGMACGDPFARDHALKDANSSRVKEVDRCIRIIQGCYQITIAH